MTNHEIKNVEPALPPSLAVSPNIPWEEQTVDQLEAERDYWVRCVERSTGPASALVADSFRRCCEEMIARREQEIQAELDADEQASYEARYEDIF